MTSLQGCIWKAIRKMLAGELVVVPPHNQVEVPSNNPIPQNAISLRPVPPSAGVPILPNPSYNFYSAFLSK